MLVDEGKKDAKRLYAKLPALQRERAADSR
jgi:hypothetical protein